MLEKHIMVNKTARYFVLGELSAKIERLWFVCHGYGQSADYFLKNFEILNNGKNLVVAPEGLHRFYWNGFEGKVVACWMTREDRLNDINDYVNYLDALYDEILKEFKGKKIKITVLGFSQGVATVCRWLCLGKAKTDNLILWAGYFPPDLPPAVPGRKNIFEKIKTQVVVGNQDEFLKESSLEEHQKSLENYGIKYRLTRFNGRHEIDPEVLMGLKQK